MVVSLIRESFVLKHVELSLIRTLVKVWEVQNSKERVADLIKVVFNLASKTSDQKHIRDIT